MTVSADTPAARVALVAGAFDRRADPAPLGRALAAAFARRGWDLALQCGSGAARADADAAAADVAALGRRAAVLDADLALEADAATLIAACGAALGRPACAVFVSACAGADDAQTIDGATLAAALARNVTAPLALARALADATPDAARDDEALRACAIHVLDQALFHPAPAQLSHALMQAALSRATSALALALAPKVRVAALVRGRAPHADDIAAAACYLANAPGVTGATLTVDGGEHLVPPADGPNE
ncbi:Rossmann fold domain-containing protein [Burkholderia multivorans]|uniref:Rossmann fold domain-containing protein n=1 Tax=Burkholderia multivorans TaxID=87883 RepID=UPI0012DDB52E|nr:short-chain dehydrogenase [Burkholderia multivorans]MBU9341898.1 short-chain dehydrogenase [Burkholderia multivorans]MCA8140582.1 short-chain dehydrogenase [Burkholderia multivorans]MCO1365361.1 short-chain dehydrogenase [Burkholderia multivorans]MCO1374968.1 short-chain dehydrogenase [Burkholderia multivorans]QGR59136.1 short-chain dehydrogenase [Burkholderia multivorans]